MMSEEQGHPSEEAALPSGDTLGRKARQPDAFLPLCLCIVLAAVVLKELTAGYFDNDFYHIASSGRWMEQHGIMYQNPYFILDGYDTIIQQWLYALLLYKSYAAAGFYGVWFFTLLQVALLILLVRRYLHLRQVEASPAWIGALLLPLAVPELNCRPELVSLCLLTAQMICTEHYLRYRKKAILYLLPVLTLLEINLHAAYVLFHFIFLLPYLFPAEKLPIVRELQQALGITVPKRPGKEIVPPLLLMLVTLPVNPYGFRAVTLLWHSRGLGVLSIWELQPLSIKDGAVAIVIIGLLLLAITLYFKRLEQPTALFFAGLLLLALLARKNVLLFAPALMSLAGDLLADAGIGKYLEKLCLKSRKLRSIITSAVLVISTGILLWEGLLRIRYTDGELQVENGLLPVQQDCESYPIAAIRYILEHEADPAQVKVMTGFNNGAAFLWNGIGHIYIEPKTEPYFQGINHKEDVVSEYHFVTAYASSEDLEAFLERYDFDYICCSAAMDGLRVYLEQTGQYRKAVDGERTISGYMQGQERNVPEYRLYEKVNGGENNP